MSDGVFITGAGWVTPLGAGLDEVWHAVKSGTPVPALPLANPHGRPLRAAPVPAALVDAVARHPRLRRSSNISLFAAAAAMAALGDARLDAARPGRLAIILAAADGSVIYTRKFYDQVVREGAGSPLFFPETVYNAPASHVAHLLGIDGITYTLAGDAAAGVAALRMGADLLLSGQADHCLVLGAQEADWILAEAYSRWRLGGSESGAVISDGAAAIVLGREGRFRLDAVSAGAPIFRRREAAESLRQALAQVGGPAADVIIRSANGTWADDAEAAALDDRSGPCAPSFFPKRTLGDAFGASALMQVICATRWLSEHPGGDALVPVVGLTHQAAAARISCAT